MHRCHQNPAATPTKMKLFKHKTLCRHTFRTIFSRQSVAVFPARQPNTTMASPCLPTTSSRFPARQPDHHPHGVASRRSVYGVVAFAGSVIAFAVPGSFVTKESPQSGEYVAKFPTLSLPGFHAVVKTLSTGFVVGCPVGEPPLGSTVSATCDAP